MYSIVLNREIGEKDSQDLSLDTSGTKSYASFVSEVARLLPSQIKSCVTLLFPHLNGEVLYVSCYTDL